MEKDPRSRLDRVKSGSYVAPPVKRVQIPKDDGPETRPIGRPTIEDKVLQRAIAMLLEPIYEQDFKYFSYGFRPAIATLPGRLNIGADLKSRSIMNSISTANSTPVSRRRFLKHSSVAVASVTAMSNFPWARMAHAAPDDPIRIGVIGCGGRGTGAAADALGAATNVVYPQAGYHSEDLKADASLVNKNVTVIALADVFPDRLNACRDQLVKLKISIPK